jgi:hypothetical protein
VHVFDPATGRNLTVGAAADTPGSPVA